MQAYFFMHLCFSLYLIEFFKAWFYSRPFRKDFLLFLSGVWGNYQLKNPLTEFSTGKFYVAAQVMKIPAPNLQESSQMWMGLLRGPYFLFVFYSFQGQGHSQYVFSTSFPMGHLCFSSQTEGVTFMQSHLCVEDIRLYSYVVGVLGLYLSKFLELLPFLPW